MSKITYNATLAMEDALRYASVGLLDVPENSWPEFLRRIAAHVELLEKAEEYMCKEAYAKGYHEAIEES